MQGTLRDWLIPAEAALKRDHPKQKGKKKKVSRECNITVSQERLRV